VCEYLCLCATSCIPHYHCLIYLGFLHSFCVLLLPRGLFFQRASKETSSLDVRRMLSSIGVLVLLVVQIVLMLQYNHFQANYAVYFGNEWYSRYCPIIVYFAFCNVSGAVFYPLSAMLNEFEKHPTKVNIFRPCVFVSAARFQRWVPSE
jgi:hypothetical protein